MAKKITDQMFDEMDENNMSAKDLLGVVMHLVDYILKNDRMFSQK